MVKFYNAAHVPKTTGKQQCRDNVIDKNISLKMIKQACSQSLLYFVFFDDL